MKKKLKEVLTYSIIIIVTIAIGLVFFEYINYKKVSAVEYSLWTIGVTDDPEIRREEHEGNGKDVNDWEHWIADSKRATREVEKHFIDLGMQGVGGGGDAEYVYIF